MVLRVRRWICTASLPARCLRPKNVNLHLIRENLHQIEISVALIAIIAEKKMFDMVITNRPHVVGVMYHIITTHHHPLRFSWDTSSHVRSLSDSDSCFWCWHWWLKNPVPSLALASSFVLKLRTQIGCVAVMETTTPSWEPMLVTRGQSVPAEVPGPFPLHTHACCVSLSAGFSSSQSRRLGFTLFYTCLSYHIFFF